MKKMFTLIAGLLITATIFAADPRPMVTISSSKNYKVVVDGRSYFGSNAQIRIANLAPGTHSIRVYEMKRGIFDRSEKLISSTTFRMNRKDVRISIDPFGRVIVAKMKGKGKKIRKQDHRYDNDRRFDSGQDHPRF